MDEYIEDKRSALIISEELIDLTIPKVNAYIRVALKKEHKRLQKFKQKFVESESFTKMVTSRKKI